LPKEIPVAHPAKGNIPPAKRGGRLKKKRLVVENAKKRSGKEKKNADPRGKRGGNSGGTPRGMSFRGRIPPKHKPYRD